MMAKTHLTMGMATSLAVSFFAIKPETLSDNLIVLAGGAVGGVLADVDTVDNDSENHDAFLGQFLSAVLLAIVLIIDYNSKLGVCEYVINQNRTLSIIGGIALVVLYIWTLYGIRWKRIQSGGLSTG